MQYVSHEWAHVYSFYGKSQQEERAKRPPITLNVDVVAHFVERDFEQHEATSHFVITALNHTRHVLLVDSIDVFYRMSDVAKRSLSILRNDETLLSSNYNDKHNNKTLNENEYDFEADRQRRWTLLHERVANVDQVLQRLRSTKWAKYDIHRRIYYNREN